jgi:hypothetical protein
MSALPVAADPPSVWERLLARDPLAPSDLCAAYLDPLIDWLSRQRKSADPDLVAEAAERALLSLISNPRTYDPRRGGLEGYLRLSARGDLLNLLAKEWRYRARTVELDARGGNYLGREDDPGWRLSLAEEAARLSQPPPGWSAEEVRVRELMRHGERRTPVFAEAIGVAHLPKREQEAAVKRVKYRIGKRRERGGEP